MGEAIIAGLALLAAVGAVSTFRSWGRPHVRSGDRGGGAWTRLPLSTWWYRGG